MSTNSKIVRAYYSAVDSGDIDSLLGLFSQDAIYERPGYPPLVGHHDLRRFYTEDRVLTGGTHKLQALLGDGNSVGCWGRYTGKKKSRDSVDVTFADFYTFDNGRMATRRTFFFVAAV